MKKKFFLGSRLRFFFWCPVRRKQTIFFPWPFGSSTSSWKWQMTMTEWQKTLYIILRISGTIHHMIIIYTAICKMITSPGIFFSYKMLVFQVVEREVAQNYKNFCLLHLIFQEPYIMWSSFMVHIYV